MLKEISLFMENTPGILSQFVKLLKANAINLKAISVAQTKDYGLAMIIVDKPTECVAVLEENEYEYSVRDVIAVNMSGADLVNDIAEIMGINNINIEYMYSILLKREKDEAYIILHTNDNQNAATYLKEKGISLLEGI